MKGYWDEIWRSPMRATMAGAILSALIASVLYGFNWHTFYDTRSNDIQSRSDIIASDITNLAKTTDAGPGKDEAFRKALGEYLATEQFLITVERKGESSNDDWLEKNNIEIDTSRTQVESSFTFDAGDAGSKEVSINIKMGVRPKFMVALTRAWSFSALDYYRDSDSWHSNHLINRSKPLYGYLLTIIIVGFGTIRAFYKDQQELLRLELEGKNLEQELGELRDEHSDQVTQLERQISNTQSQRDDALKLRNELADEIDAIEKEYRELVDTGSKENSDDPRIIEAAHRKSQVERVLSSYNTKVAHFERELEDARSELSAAEHLLFEVEERREGVNTKLRDRNKEIRKLKSLIQQTQKEVRLSQSDQLRTGRANLREAKKWEESQQTIEEQLSHWIRSSGHTSVNFSSHSKSPMVEEQFQKIDQAFVDRYFTHVNNSEYERGARKFIRVLTEGSNETEGGTGELIVVLDDDAGRTFSMRYETRKEAPASVHVGFLLAMLLRNKCKDFQNFSIRTR